MATTTIIITAVLLTLALEMTMAAPTNNITDDKMIESCCDLQLGPIKPS